MYLPLPKQVTIQESKVHGLGLFAKEYIAENTILGITHVESKDKEFSHGWIRTPLGGFYNHENDYPNCYLGTRYLETVEVKELITLMDIESGTELTCKYTLWDIESVLNLIDSANKYLGA
tara:strand:- start:102 stop:461 length:360 start_codon:yes stop_codon:yes gene_type:complete